MFRAFLFNFECYNELSFHYMNNIKVTKNTGDRVYFDRSKLERSMIRSGASESDARRVASMVCENISEGMSTHKIYKMAYDLLKKTSKKVAGRYKLKKAIFEMGPTGYPFERLICELLKLQGFDAVSGVTLDGSCVTHEVDVYARNNNKSIFVECKFHNDAHKKSDVKVSLYVNSRFEDLKNKFSTDKSDQHIFEGWIVTNTRFTADATKYGKCSGLKLISWDYPQQGNLRQLIDEAGFHPITTMHTITKKEKESLLGNNIILCRQILDSKELLSKLGITERRIKKIQSEANQIINS